MNHPMDSFSAPQPLVELKSLTVPWHMWTDKDLFHGLVVLTEAPDALPDFPGSELLKAILHRQRATPEQLQNKPFFGTTSEGVQLAWVWIKPEAIAFEIQTLLRQGLMGLLVEQPHKLVVSLWGSRSEVLAGQVLYVAWVNTQELPHYKKTPLVLLKDLYIQGVESHEQSFNVVRHLAAANGLARFLTLLPPNQLHPRSYREFIRVLARQKNWEIEEYEADKLTQMGAGAFMAVTRGSGADGSAIVRLTYRPKNSVKLVAIVGKGICFDTGGHNLKPAKAMMGMHEDMNGSAVALSILMASTELELPIAIDCWLAIAQNKISPEAYQQNEVIHSLEGSTIEIVHTDAEGRMVLADTLTLAARQNPHLILDFATLTGSMQTALGTRMSGVFASTAALAQLASAVGQTVGERVVAFPLEADYESDLESTIADICQCTLTGEADHLLAALFLRRFTAGLPWVHMDLSSSRHEGGLGAVASTVNGFGVHWGIGFLDSWIQNAL